MTPRMDYLATAPALLGKMMELEEALASSGLDLGLIELVKMRVSQINGCAFCLDMHAAIMKKSGEDMRRIVLLPAWRETAFYTPRERAALAWAEALTLVADTHAPDADYDGLRGHFTDQEIVQLTLVIGMINHWNRIAIGFRAQPRRPSGPHA
ncbi:carboxymuconolactone decarboxylase family protein [Gluconacetobacter takamatsuzukensis]|uniref:Carboxymuconolactone decarboxylase family protein n=1 Tax=Gluconacetobacter takamatsuzukensis TaxID=1286190 RepID=A0A7W4KC21_9PROT|nr:carboxymuconolactone decarboxylase family protein [Gluconacetobacter takamatsuzukensis]MBB2204181.1 carboxymuconolactone decarboxylase family protein [Gluconacetobacter takamatsuzukensis]